MTAPDNAMALGRADQAAQANFERDDLSSPMSACPAREAELFVVPARYALAEMNPEHACVKPGNTLKSQPMAVRRLRQGYLYLWHGEGPLRRFGVGKNGCLTEQDLDDQSREPIDEGTLAGLALNKHQDAWLMYADMPLTAKFCQQLTEPGIRQQRMRRIALPQVAQQLQATHCPALADAPQLIAELMPGIRDQVLASDHHNKGDQYRAVADIIGKQAASNPTPENIKAYVDAMHRAREREDAAGRHPEAAQSPPGVWSADAWDVPAAEAWLDQATRQANGLYGIFAVVDDHLGVLRDLNQAQATVNQRHEDWEAENGHKALLAGFINSLIQEDGAEVASQLSYRYMDRDLLLTADQGEAMLQAQRDLQPLLARETAINQHYRHQAGHAAADNLIADIRRQEQAILAPLRELLPSDISDIEGQLHDLVMAYRADKARNMTDSKSGHQVPERVRLEEMNAWIAEVADTHHQWLAERREQIHADQRQALPLHRQALWYTDYDNVGHCELLSRLALASLSMLCSSGPGVQIAKNMLRSPDPALPFSLLTTGFSPSLTNFLDGAGRANNIQDVLIAPTGDAARELLAGLVAAGKLDWLNSLSSKTDHPLHRTIGHLSSALVALLEEHLKGLSAMPATLVEQFPKPIQALFLRMRATTQDFVFEKARDGLRLAGENGRKLNAWALDAGKRIQQGLTPNALRGVNHYGGVLPLAALLLNGANLFQLTLRDQGREHDGVRLSEHVSAIFFTGAALSAATAMALDARGTTELQRGWFKAPTITLMGFATGLLAGIASIFGLVKLGFEMHKEDAYWTTDHWARLGREGAMSGLMGVQTGLGGYATWMVITNQWTTAQAVRWFSLRMVPVGWLVLLVEGLYFVWDKWLKDSEMQLFLEQCCWGRVRRWNDSPEQQEKELQALLTLLFKPNLQAEGYAQVERVGFDGAAINGYRTKTLQLTLPGADTNTQLYLCLAKTDGHMAQDHTAALLSSLRSAWLPAQQGMGLRLSGTLPPVTGTWELRVLYHSPLAMSSGVLDKDTLTIGGQNGVRYLIRGQRVTEHLGTAGNLASDRLPAHKVDSVLLKPKERI